MMRHRKSDPRWRDEASSEVMAACVPSLELGDHVLLAGEADPILRAALAAAGCAAHLWLRHASAAGLATAWPPEGACSAALLRLPRAKEELDMMLHAAAARVAPGGIIAVYGANDEGIRSAVTRMQPLLGDIEAADRRAHCCVLTARRPADIPGLKSELSMWRRTARIAFCGVESDWASYPGVFAKGGLDDGTRLLIGTLAGLPAPAGVLDYGCGAGVIAAHVKALFPNSQIVMADRDSLAGLAAGENVPGAQVRITSSLADLGSERYDLIVSNPPIHDGKSEDYTVLGQLIAQAPARLTTRGSLVLVVQRRVPVAEWLEAAFARVEKAAEDTRYRVWRASQPKKTATDVRSTRAHSSGVRGREH